MSPVLDPDLRTSMFFTEVVEHTPQFLAQVARVAATCADWDGTDPVRLLTRDGYRTPLTTAGPPRVPNAVLAGLRYAEARVTRAPSS